ncbi:MAG: threonine dehydratase [Actinomycetota bacterium]|nr:threonine dehydratase [Actinomycetota bacterium]
MLVSAAAVDEAAARLRGIVRATPVLAADAIGRAAGRTVLLKPEQLQRTGSFKIRGAYNRIAQLDAGVAVVAASAGNHAQGVALAALLTGRTATIFMPATAPLPKVDATSAYGATIELVDGLVDEAIVAARQHASSTGAVFVPPFDDPMIIAGQGTIGLELLREAPDATTVIVPVGGGGLISGIGVALKARRPEIRLVGVQPAAGPARTMADGNAVKSPSALTREHMDALVDEMVTVTEEEISRAVVLLLERAKAVVEPAGAVSVAALPHIGGDGPVVAVLSGGNVDPLLLTKLIDHGLSAAGRFLVLRLVVGDRPGALADLTAAVAAMGLNVLSVEHHRAGLDLAVDEVEVVLTLETRDPAHREQVCADLRGAGYRVELLR